MKLMNIVLLFAFFTGSLNCNIKAQNPDGSKYHLMENEKMSILIDKDTGGISSIKLKEDKYQMNWLRSEYTWGTGQAWSKPMEIEFEEKSCRVKYVYHYHIWKAEIDVIRKLNDDGTLTETYTFTNKSGAPTSFKEGQLGIITPFNDIYTHAETALYQRCSAHIWCGKNTAYVCALRMGGEPPHLGMVLTEGSLASYSVDTSVDGRGIFILNLEHLTLEPEESQTVSWKLFQHKGKKDFYQKALHEPGFVKMVAENYTVTAGERVFVKAIKSSGFKNPKVFVNDNKLDVEVSGNELNFSFNTKKTGEYLVELNEGNNTTFLRAYASLPLMELVHKRLAYIVKNQQVSSPGDKLDGAYAVYDTEEEKLIFGPNDHNTGRERLAMGILLALYLQQNPATPEKEKFLASLRKYYDFVKRELQTEDGEVFNGPYSQHSRRLYNFPWVVQLHMEMYKVTKDKDCLQRMLQTVRAYYKAGGINFYAICFPMLESVGVLKEAGMQNEANELLQLYKYHVDEIVKKGANYPSHEVIFEQGIVAPAADYISQMYRLTGDKKYLEESKKHISRLKVFNGNQPDFHLNEIAIRYWDGFWFGKSNKFGDTFPHYWSTLTAVAYHHYAKASGNEEYEVIARKIIKGNFNQFDDDGRGHCAYMYPFKIDEMQGQFYDAWANDQDWALVFALQYFSDMAK